MCDGLEIAFQKFRFCPSNDLAESRIDLQKSSAPVDPRDSGGGDVMEGPVATFARMKTRFGLLAGRDITRNRHSVLAAQMHVAQSHFDRERASILAAVHFFDDRRARLPDLSEHLGSHALSEARRDVVDGPRQQLFPAVPQLNAGPLIYIEIAQSLWIDNRNGITGLIEEGAKELEFLKSTLLLLSCLLDFRAAGQQFSLGTCLFGDIVSRNPHRGVWNSLAAQHAVVSPDAPLAGTRRYRHQAARFSRFFQLSEINVKLRAKLESEDISQGNLEEFLNAVSKHPGGSRIHRKDSAFKIVHAQKILAVLNEILIPVFA